MSETNPLPADRQLLCQQRFMQRLRGELRGLINEDLIDEHRQDPLGRHGDALERVLNYIHKAPAFALYSRTPCREWQLVRLPVEPGSSPLPIDQTVFTDEAEALHAWFVAHLELLKAE